jgi:S-ribosylhomocysteine lyase
MVDVTQLGWDPATVGELDHRRLQAPHVKLRSATEGPAGDVVYCVDLRVCAPNGKVLSATEMHSLEHFLLAGFQKYLPDNFLSVAPMGCRTGFYLVLLNEGRREKICEAYERILSDILAAGEVPYANISQCGNYRDHDARRARRVADRILSARSLWNRVV